MAESEYFVYVYRDGRGRPIYIGRGRRTGRVLAPHNHNSKLAKKLERDKKIGVEIAGPFGSDEAAEMVETALISAIGKTPALRAHLLNQRENTHKYQFRSLAVPIDFADRDGQPRLEAVELDNLVAKSKGPLLFVNISNRNFGDDGRGFDPARPPSDKYVLERFEKYWQLRKLYFDHWNDNPNLFPRTLVGLFGPRDKKIVIGSVKIDLDHEGRWNCSDEDFFTAGLMKVPVRLSDNEGLDYLKLRGRTIAAEKVGLVFGRVRQRFFQIFGNRAAT